MLYALQNEIVWQSTVTRDMLLNYAPDDVRHIINELDDAVMAVLQEYESVHKYKKNNLTVLLEQEAL